MQIDAKMLKEINKTVDGFVKKNKLSIDNAREIEKLGKKLDRLEKDYQANANIFNKIGLTNLEAVSKNSHRLLSLLLTVQDLEKKNKELEKAVKALGKKR